MELFRALAALAEAPAAGLEPVAASLDLGPPPPVDVHTELFGMQLVPYASIYLGAEGRIGGEARDRIAGFWRALGAEPPRESDHLSVLLAGYAELSAIEAAAAGVGQEAARHRRRTFFHEHLASWLPVYLCKLTQIAPRFYRRWGELLHRALAVEASRLGPPPAEPIHHRLAPGLPDDAEDRGELLDALMAPVRTGFVLTRRDLASAARQIGIGSRIGERRFMLEAMLRQRPQRVGAWLLAYCDSTLASYARGAGALDRQLLFWKRRVEASRERLRDCF